MASYDPNSEAFGKMQEEALRRLREMQRRSRSIVGASQPGSQPEANAPPQRPAQPQAIRPNVHSGSQPENANPLGDIIKSILGDGLKLDSDRVIIMLLLFVLYKNGADIKLLIALGYLML